MPADPRPPVRRAGGWTRRLPAGIRARLLVLILLALLPMLLLLGWVYAQRYVDQRAQALQTEQEVAHGVETTFTAFLHDVRHAASVVGRAAVTFTPYSAAKVTALLVDMAAQYPAITNVNWVSPAGRILASNIPGSRGTELGDRPYFRALQRGEAWVVSDLLPQGRVSGRPAFVVAQGIRDAEGRLRGVVVASIDPTRLGVLVLTLRRPAGGAYTIFDRQGVLVYRSPETPLTWQQRAQWQDTDPLLRQALRTGRPATGITPLGIGAGQWMAARVPIAGIGWVAGAGRPVAYALGPLWRRLAMDALLALLVTAMAFALAIRIGRTIVAPLRRVQHDVQRFGAGDLAHRAATDGPSEVAQLAAGFNQMAAEIETFQGTLEDRVRQRTAALETANKELESFSYTVAHDLRSPLRAMDGYSKYLLEHYADRLDARGQEYFARIRTAAQRLGRLIDDLLTLTRVVRMPLRPTTVDLSALATDIVHDLRRREPERRVTAEIAGGMTATGDAGMLRMALAHLLDNAWKFTGPREDARITVGADDRDGARVYYVRDNGVGFDTVYAHTLFQPFHRLHAEEEFSGTGIGLTLVQRIIQRHGGRVWAEGALDQGATIYFTLGEESR